MAGYYWRVRTVLPAIRVATPHVAGHSAEGVELERSGSRGIQQSYLLGKRTSCQLMPDRHRVGLTFCAAMQHEFQYRHEIRHINRL
jgi:hypothetical protein